MSAAKILRVGKDDQRHNPGIHLLDPTDREIADAQERAASYGFETIYIHDSRIDGETGGDK